MVAYPKDWEEKILSDIGQVKMCKRIFSHQTHKSGAVPFYKIGTFGGAADAFISMELFREYKDKYPYPEKGDVLISASGSIGKTVIFNGKDSYFQDSNIVWLDVDDSEVYNKFLYYFYESFPWESTEGTTIKRLYNDLILKTNINLPPLSEQQAIADTLSTFDEHIDNLTELIEKKKAIRDGALDDLVTGKVRLDGFDGEWESCKIKDVLTILHGKSQHLVESPHGKYPILGSGGIIGKTNTFLCDWTCVLIGRKGTIDNPIYMETPFWTIDTLYYSRPKLRQCPKFQYFLFCTIDWYEYTESSGRPSLPKDVIENIDIKVPEDEEQQAIASVLTAMDEELNNLEHEKEKILQMKAGAMDDLLTGKIRLV